MQRCRLNIVSNPFTMAKKKGIESNLGKGPSINDVRIFWPFFNPSLLHVLKCPKSENPLEKWCPNFQNTLPEETNKTEDSSVLRCRKRLFKNIWAIRARIFINHYGEKGIFEFGQDLAKLDTNMYFWFAHPLFKSFHRPWLHSKFLQDTAKMLLIPSQDPQEIIRDVMLKKIWDVPNIPLLLPLP